MRKALFVSLLSLWAGVCCQCAAFGQVTEPAAPARQQENAIGEAQPKPGLLLRQMADYMTRLPAFSCDVEISSRIQAAGRDVRNQFKMAVRLQRPNTIALVIDEGPQAMAIKSDGKSIAQHIPSLNRYTSGAAPADLAAFASSDVSALLSKLTIPSSVIPTSADNYFEALTDGVTGSEYLGTEKTGESLCHHCRFLRDDSSWDIWIETGDRPLVRKIVPDVAKLVTGLPADAKMEYVVTISQWNTAPKFADADFAFTPPAGAEKVDALFARSRDREEAPHPLLGSPSPTFAAFDLENQPIDLKAHFGKNVVMLDFWATWCGPCIAAMPEVSGVAKKYAEQGLVFYAVNVGEDIPTVKEFLKTKGFDVPVAMDPTAEAAQGYKVTGIPQTVLVGKDGKVQVVHIGFGGNLAATLSKEVEDLLAGKDLASAILERARQKKAVAIAAGGLKQVWSVPGSWSGVAADGRAGIVIATSPAKEAVSIGADGKTLRELALAQGGLVRLANLAGDATPELLVFKSWGPSVKAYNAEGKALWEYPGGTGVNDVSAVDVDGDGIDEVVIGFNGDLGVHLVDARGSALWKSKDMGNVWHVAAGDFDNDRAIDVVATSSQGVVHVLSAKGDKLKDIDVPLYANMVRMARLGDGSQAAIVSGPGGSGDVMTSVNFAGERKWTLALPESSSNRVDEMMIAPAKPWVAVAMRGGTVHVVDLDSGQIIAHAGEQGMRPQVAWLSREGKTPLLLVATGKEVSAFEVAPENAGGGAQ